MLIFSDSSEDITMTTVDFIARVHQNYGHWRDALTVQSTSLRIKLRSGVVRARTAHSTAVFANLATPTTFLALRSVMIL